MKSIIGLLTHEKGLDSSVQELQRLGFAEDRISVLDSEVDVRKALNCELYCAVPKYLILGTALGIITYISSAVLAGWCQCNLLGYEGAFGIGTFLGGILAGAFIGGFIGLILGVAESEGDSHLYVQGVRRGGKLISIQAKDNEIENVKNLLKHESALGVKTLE